MYRLFVTCDNPKGVVDCGTIRKHRNCSQKMKEKNKVQKTTENLDSSLINNKTYKQEKFPKLGSSNGNLIIPSSLQHNNMINSWSEDIAEDLLKGAIDLQDSLIILRNNLHDTSRRKPTEKPERDRTDLKVIGKTRHASQFSEQSSAIGSNGSSSNCTVELKRVIKESLVKQKLFPSATNERLDSASETPTTTTSSHSSEPKMERGHNVVAKLMGLEEISSRTFPSMMQKKLDGEKILNQKRPVFEIDRKLKAEIVSSKGIKHKNGSNSTNLVILKEVVKMEAKGIKPIEESVSKGKLNCHISHTSMVSDKICKAQTNSRKVPEKDVSESRIVAKPQDHGEITSTNLRKLKSGSRIHNIEISSLKRTYSNTISMSKTMLPKINNSKDLSMEIKENISVVVSSMRRKNQMKNRSPVSKPESASATLIAEKIGQGGKKKSVYVTEEYKRRKKISAEVAHESSNCNETDELKHFLLTSQTFIGHSEKLFNLDMDCPKSKTLRRDHESNGIALYLDCANELVERKSLQESRVVRSFSLTCEGNTRLHITLSRLVEEICDAIEKLKSYRENYGVELLEDDLFAMMEKDMMCNGVINNGIWEHSWRHGFSAFEVEQVVNKLESLVLGGLIEDIILNL